MRKIFPSARSGCHKLSGIKSVLFFTAACLLSVTGLRAQPIPCPPNIDFEQGTFNGWTLYTGSTSGSSTDNPTWNQVPLPAAGRHTITVGTAVDYYGGFPIVAPGGGTYSVKIGDDESGAQADRARYYIQVPSNSNFYSFTYRYAVVFEDPNHTPQNQQPKFVIRAYDSATGIEIPCADQTYIAGANIPGFLTSPNPKSTGTPVYYLPWKSGSVNLSGQGGKTIAVDFMAFDCPPGAHFGYGYVDMISCGEFKAAIATCDLDNGGITLTAPPGYATYTWYNHDYSTVVGTGVVVANVTPPLPANVFHVVMIPFAGPQCADTLTTEKVGNILVDASPDTLCFKGGVPVQLGGTVSGGIAPLTYQWTGNGLDCDTCLSPVAVGYGNQTYVLRVTDSIGCNRSDTLQFIESNFTMDAGASFVTCVGTPVQLDGSVDPAVGNYNFNWTPAGGLSNANVLDPTYTPGAVGTETLYLRVDSGLCHQVDSITVRTLPNDFSVSGTVLCQGQDFMVPGSGDTAFTYKWSPAIGVSDSTIVNPTITTDTTRTYTVTASYPTCPDIVKTVTVEVQPVPKVNIGLDTSKCQWDVLPINALVSPSWYPDYTYAWDPNPGLNDNGQSIPNVVFSGQQSSEIILSVTTPHGCEGRDSMFITVHQGNFAQIDITDTAMCPNNSVQFHITGGQQYDWQPPVFLDDSYIANPVSSPVTNVDYTAYVQDEFGCYDTMYAHITVHPEAVLSMPDSIVIYPGETAQINTQGNASYFQWREPTGLSSTRVGNPVASPDVSTRYYVKATTESGCSVEDSIDIVVKTESVVALPNAFSPGSAPNDLLKINKRGISTLKYYRIFNRWGQKVFETADIEQGWDGRYNGTPQPMGVYIYSIEGTTSNGKPFNLQGNVTLIR